MTIAFDSPAHSPEGPRGYSLLRVPAANSKPRGPGVVPGERIALDEWFAEPPQGFAALIHTDASVPGHPAYRISIAPDDLRDPAVRKRVEVIAIFEGISDAMLQAVVEAYLGLSEKETLQSWTMMETIVSVVGFILILGISYLIP